MLPTPNSSPALSRTPFSDSTNARTLPFSNNVQSTGLLTPEKEEKKRPFVGPKHHIVKRVKIDAKADLSDGEQEFDVETEDAGVFWRTKRGQSVFGIMNAASLGLRRSTAQRQSVACSAIPC
jgi:hypothetical protein